MYKKLGSIAFFFSINIRLCIYYFSIRFERFSGVD